MGDFEDDFDHDSESSVKGTDLNKQLPKSNEANDYNNMKKELDSILKMAQPETVEAVKEIPELEV